MAASSKRALWKGAISFGLVHIPIALHSATEDQRLNFDWLDKRSMDPVGYKRINKATGDAIAKEDIAKGIEYEDGQYVIVSPEELSAANPKTTQTVEIEAFVSVNDIPFVYLERPYYISPINKGAKVYALLREVPRKTGKVGVAKVVIQTKQHLAVLMPCGPALILNLLRWSDEIRSWDELNLPAEGLASAGLSTREMAMGEQLVADMSTKWKPKNFTDSFKDQILQLVKEKVAAGDTQSVMQPEAQDTETSGAKIYDLTQMLQRSLNIGSAKRVKKSDDTVLPAAKPRHKSSDLNPTASKQPAASAATKSPTKTTAASTPKSAKKSAAKPASHKDSKQALPADANKPRKTHGSKAA